MKWSILVLGAVIIIVGVIVLLQPKSVNDTEVQIETNLSVEEPAVDQEFNVLVTYTNQGFSPESVTIAQGETVRFLNQAGSGLWVGGDNHPTHNQYPETAEDACLGTSFDTCRVLKAGEFWEFTFNHRGTWGLHNHIRANNTAEIIVK